jgi:hypothetical protein
VSAAPDLTVPTPLAAAAAVRTRNRGWLLRRSLAAADMVGLLLAFIVAERLVHDNSGAHDRLGGLTEYLVFFASLPVWVLLARQYGLYALDEEHPVHSTADDVIRVFNMLTVGTWGFFVFTWLTHVARPSVSKLAEVLVRRGDDARAVRVDPPQPSVGDDADEPDVRYSQLPQPRDRAARP